ncbi:MAG: RRXRR domain-containing protein, partial [Cyanobacteria bacterium P01_H01_bin.121]
MSQNYVLVVDQNRKPLTPCKPRTARRLLAAGKASRLRFYPFTIILHKAIAGEPKACQLKLDPGSKTTGLVLLKGDQVIWAAELTHRGQQIKDALEKRRALR